MALAIIKMSKVKTKNLKKKIKARINAEQIGWLLDKHANKYSYKKN